MSALRIISNRPRSTPGTYLPECPTGYVRVAIFTPSGDLACSKFGLLDKGVVKVRLFEREEVAEPCAVVPGTGARYKVTMPVWAEEVDDAA